MRQANLILASPLAPLPGQNMMRGEGFPHLFYHHHPCIIPFNCVQRAAFARFKDWERPHDKRSREDCFLKEKKIHKIAWEL